MANVHGTQTTPGQAVYRDKTLTYNWQNQWKKMTSQSEALIGQRQAGWHERMGEAGCGYLASKSRPQHWLKKKTKTSTTVKLLILSFNPFISLSYTRTIISFGAVGKNWFPNHLSFVLCKRNRDIVQSITLTQKMKSYMRSEFSDCCSQNIERRFSHCCCCFFNFCFVLCVNRSLR